MNVLIQEISVGLSTSSSLGSPPCRVGMTMVGKPKVMPYPRRRTFLIDTAMSWGSARWKAVSFFSVVEIPFGKFLFFLQQEYHFKFFADLGDFSNIIYSINRLKTDRLCAINFRIKIIKNIYKVAR